MQANIDPEKRTCVKVKFFTQMSRIYGIILIILGENNNYIEEVAINLSGFSIFYNKINNNSGFKDFYTVTTDTKETLKSHRKKYFILKNVIEKDNSFIDKFFKNSHKKIDIVELESELKESIRKAINDKKIVIFANIEAVPTVVYTRLQNEINEAQQQRNEILDNEASQVEEEKPDFFEIGSNEVLRNCSPVVSPVGGVPVTAIDEGDKIYVTITSEEEDAEPAAQKRIDAIKTTVAKIAFEGGLHKILVQIDEKTFGKIEEAESVKIKTIKKPTPVVSKHRNISRRRDIVWLMLSIFILILFSIYMFLFVLL